MRRLCPVVMLCLAVAAGCAPLEIATQNAQQAAPLAVADARQLVVLTDKAPEDVIATARALGYEVRAVHPLGALNDSLVSLTIPEGRSIPEAIAEIESALPGVTAGANHLYQMQAGSSTDDPRDYALGMIGWPAQGCRAQVRVGMIDGGVAHDHPDLQSGRIAQRSFATIAQVPTAKVPADQAQTDHAPKAPILHTSRHGAQVAALLIGPDRLRDTVLHSANVIDPTLGRDGSAGVVAILRAVDWLAAQDVDVVNISLAGPYNKLMNRALGTAAAQGMTLVAAVGNLGPDQPPQYPAGFPFALAVTAVDRDGAIYRKAVRGPHVDVAAPGVDILTLADGRLRVASGTSLAAPFVTNVIAADPALARMDVPDLRDALATRAVDLGERGRDDIFGVGLIRAKPSC